MENNREKTSPLSNTILVVTPISSTGKIIIQSLQDVGFNDALYFPNARYTISYLQKKRLCKVALIDLEMGEDAALTLSNSLQSICPNINLVFVSKQYLSEDFDFVRPWKFLQKPYQLADLLDILEITPSATASSSIIDVEPISTNVQNWLMEPAVAKSLLAQLVAQTDAQGALVYQNDQLWSFAGDLSEKSIQDIDQYVMKKWDKRSGEDFLCYPKISHNEKNQVLYATSLLLGVLLAVVFDIKIPVTRLRTQTKSICSKLRHPELTASDPIKIKNTSRLELASGFNENNTTVTRPSIQMKQTNEANISVNRSSLDWIYPDDNRDFLNPALINSNTYLSGSGSKNPLSLSYSFQITPRNTSSQNFPFEDHDFTDWLYEIIIAHGWSIDQLEIKQESISWRANVSPLISLADYINIIRHELSTRILENFPRLREEYPTGDFWAPGYNVRVSNKTIPSI